MAVKYHYYKLKESESESLKVWKGCHITIYLLAVIFAITCFSCFDVLNDSLEGHCALFPTEIVFDTQRPTNETRAAHYGELSDDKNVTSPTLAVANGNDSSISNDNDNSTIDVGPNIRVDIFQSQWSAVTDCETPFYIPVVSTIFGLIWCCFFTMCPASGSGVLGLKKPWRILLPATIFSMIFSCVCLHYALHLQKGIGAFCENFSPATNTTECSSTMDAHMDSASSIFTLSQLLSVLLTSSWLHTICWLISWLLAILRCLCIADFERVHIVSTKAGSPGSGKFSHKKTDEDSPNNEVIVVETHSTSPVEQNIQGNDVDGKEYASNLNSNIAEISKIESPKNNEMIELEICQTPGGSTQRRKKDIKLDFENV